MTPLTIVVLYDSYAVRDIGRADAKCTTMLGCQRPYANQKASILIIFSNFAFHFILYIASMLGAGADKLNQVTISVCTIFYFAQPNTNYR